MAASDPMPVIGSEQPALTADPGAGKLAARVALRIEHDIARAGWPIGHVLGSEPALQERYQVSRQVLREAIRLVEHHRVAAMRRGPFGGLVVCAPDARAATSAMLMYLEFANTTLEHVLAVRLAVEPLAAALAAEHITEPGIAELRGLLEDEAATCPHPRSLNRLHLALARLCGNPALELFVQVLCALTARYDRGPNAASDRALADAHQSHRGIVAAVVAGETSPAQFRATEHLTALRRHLCERRPPLQATGAAEAPNGVAGDVKLAELVAQQIIAEIRTNDWGPGTVIGSEAALLDRLNIGRSVLREAVRLLEYHSIAYMRRGPGGGLIINKPDPTASVQAIARHLRYRGTSPSDLCVLRGAVELESVNHVSAVAHDPPLDAALAGLACDDWHLRLAQLSGNPVLWLFLRILITLRPLPADMPPTEAEHDGITAALLGGDRALARHRMRHHLRRLDPPA